MQSSSLHGRLNLIQYLNIKPNIKDYAKTISWCSQSLNILSPVLICYFIDICIIIFILFKMKAHFFAFIILSTIVRDVSLAHDNQKVLLELNPMILKGLDSGGSIAYKNG